MIDTNARASALAIAFLVASALPVSAASSGLAWDSVTKLAMGADASSLQPGSFSDDFAAASAPQQSGGGLFGHMIPQQALAMMHSGIAERHYVAGSKERTDQVAAQTATIVDCRARTITTLDLAKKTYRVSSMDQPSTPGTAQGSSGGSEVKDDGTKVAIAITNTALGARQVAGEATNGYSSQITFTETPPSGESRTMNTSLVGYYANFGMPLPQCAGAMNATGMAGMGGNGQAMMASVRRLMQALRSNGSDPRFSIKQSGPALPLGGFAMYQAMTFAMGSRAPTMVTERGDVHSLDPSDPVFSVPSDFTQLK